MNDTFPVLATHSGISSPTLWPQRGSSTPPCSSTWQPYKTIFPTVIKCMTIVSWNSADSFARLTEIPLINLVCVWTDLDKVGDRLPFLISGSTQCRIIWRIVWYFLFLLQFLILLLMHSHLGLSASDLKFGFEENVEIMNRQVSFL